MSQLVGRPDNDYAATWLAFPDDDAVVIVVATTGDVRSAREDLRRVLPEPANLCVYRTATGQQLEAAMSAVRRDADSSGLLGHHLVVYTGAADGFAGLTGAVTVVDGPTVAWLRERAGELFLPHPQVRLDR